MKWVYKTKHKPNGEMEKYKAMLVAKLYNQEFDIDYEEIFSPRAKIDTVRMFLSLASHKCCLVYQLDVKSAFLNGKIEEEVYVAQPRGFEVLGKEMMVYYMDLNKLKELGMADWMHGSQFKVFRGVLLNLHCIGSLRIMKTSCWYVFM